MADSTTSTPPLAGRHTAWLRLFRVPNLLTVPGDPFAGFLLASGGRSTGVAALLLAGLASLSLYMAGLVTNDLADRDEDARQRRERPLPAGHIRPAQAQTAAYVLLGLAAFCCIKLGPKALWIGTALLGAILSYNFGLKKIPMVGALNMGACRGLSLLLGAAAVPERAFPETVLVAAATLTLYVAAVTNIARHEAEPRQLSFEGWLPLASLLMGFTVFQHLMPEIDRPDRWAFFIAAGGAGAVSLVGTSRILRALYGLDPGTLARHMGALPAIVADGVGSLLSALLFIQAAFLFASGSPPASWILAGLAVLAWPLHRILCRIFYAS